jgi:hypothetical protein
MANPVAPAKFAAPSDVEARYIEGTWGQPATRDWDAWAQERIEDVEAILIGLVPSLDATVVEIAAEPGGANRLRNAKTLVVSKVLELRRNPTGAAQISQSMDGLSADFGTRSRATSQEVWFSEQELDSVRRRTVKRRIGMIPVGPGPWR